MRYFYVSLVNDLLGTYLMFQAESELAVRQYLYRNYLHEIKGRVYPCPDCNLGRIVVGDTSIWKLPWCSVYTEIPEIDRKIAIVIPSRVGLLYEETASFE